MNNSFRNFSPSSSFSYCITQMAVIESRSSKSVWRFAWITYKGYRNVSLVVKWDRHSQMELLPGILSFRWLFAVMTRKRNREKEKFAGILKTANGSNCSGSKPENDEINYKLNDQFLWFNSLSMPFLSLSLVFVSEQLWNQVEILESGTFTFNRIFEIFAHI